LSSFRHLRAGAGDPIDPALRDIQVKGKQLQEDISCATRDGCWHGNCLLSDQIRQTPTFATIRRNPHMNTLDKQQGDQGRPRETLSLRDARDLAAKDKSNWCIVPFGFDLAVGKMILDQEVRLLSIRDDAGTVLRFPAINEARQFLRDELGISRTMMVPG
jgi:hypothetical protein